MEKINILETERTYLRKLTTAHAELFYLLNLDEEVMKYTGEKPFDNVQEATDFLSKYDQYDKYKVGRFAVLDKDTDQYIGWCGLKYSNDEYDIGFRFYRKYWNHGFATETALKCLEYGFADLGIDMIVGRAMKANLASIRVLEKIGMNFKEPFDFEGNEGVIYHIHREEWQ